MIDNHYFKEMLDNINRVRNSIRFYGELIERSEEKLDIDNKEDYEKALENINEYSKFLQENKDELCVLEEQFNTMCSFTREVTLSFLVRILNDIGDIKYSIVNTGNEYIISSSDKEEKYTFAIDEKINLYEFIESPGALLIKHPELLDIAQELLNIKAHDNWLKDFNEMRVFQKVYACMPANHRDIINTEVKMHPGFKTIINDVVGNIYGGSEPYHATRDDYKRLYHRIMDGELNNLMEVSYWFGSKVATWNLASLEVVAREYNMDLNLTKENYIVYAELLNIINHVKYLVKEGDYYISLTGHHQTPPTEDELEEIESIMRELLSRDYTWREAREMARAINNLDYMTNYEFPHELRGLRSLLNVKVSTIFDKMDDDIDLRSDTSKLASVAEELMAKLQAKEDIRSLFSEDAKSSEEEYLRRQVLANWDIIRVFKDKRVDLEGQDKIKDELISGTKLSANTLDVLFKLENYDYGYELQNHKKELVDLAYGTLKAFIKSNRIKNLFEEAKATQLSFGLNNGTVGYSDINTHSLPNGQTLYSTYCEDIKPKYQRLQKQYDYLYDNASDAEFLEGAIEIFGDILMMQVFRSGNKRIAKSIFNQILLSRGIIPPISDLLEQDKRLWLDIAYGRFERYMRAKYKLLLQTVDVKRQFAEQNFHEPLSVDDMERWRKGI